MRRKERLVNHVMSCKTRDITTLSEDPYDLIPGYMARVFTDGAAAAEIPTICALLVSEIKHLLGIVFFADLTRHNKGRRGVAYPRHVFYHQDRR